MTAVDDDAPRRFVVRDIPTSQPSHGGVRVKVVKTGVGGTVSHRVDLAAYGLGLEHLRNDLPATKAVATIAPERS